MAKERFCITRVRNNVIEYQVATTPEQVDSKGVPIANLLWNKKNLTYAVGRDSKDVPKHYAEHYAINMAFTKWEVECNLSLKLVKLSDNPDIIVKFVDGKTDNIISGDDTIMGYSGFPGTSLQGQVNLNDDLAWGWSSVNFSWNVNQTLTHEIGHVIGMEHIPNCPKCIMYPIYNNSLELGGDDIVQITTAYGTKIYSSPSLYSRIKNWLFYRIREPSP